MGKVYVAYGSNMDIGRMFSRCEHAECIGRGWLEGYALTFQRSASGYYANVRKDKKSGVPVILYRITEEDEKTLDKFEGYPICYKKVEVEVIDEEGKEITGMAYILPKSREYGVPSIKYYNLIRRSYQIYDFDEDILREGLVYSFKRAKSFLKSTEDRKPEKKENNGDKNQGEIE